MGRKTQLITHFIFSILITIPIWLTFSNTLLQLNCIFDSPLGKVFCMVILHNKHRQHIIKQRQHFANKGPYSQSYGFSSSHVQMWELDHKEGWALKNWRLWIMVLEKTLFFFFLTSLKHVFKTQFIKCLICPLRSPRCGWGGHASWTSRAGRQGTGSLPGPSRSDARGPHGWKQDPGGFQSLCLPGMEKTLESLLDRKEIKPVNAKGKQPWIFIGRTDAEAEVLTLWPPDAKSQLIGEKKKQNPMWERFNTKGEDGRGWDG